MIKTLTKNTCRWCLMIMTLMVITTQISAQVNVSGIVTSALEKEPLPGVTVVEKGTTNGVVADVNGKFQISVTNQDAILIFSYIGYINKEVQINGQTILNISLSKNLINVDEVVVTAYSQKAKTEISSSVVSLNADDINKVTVNSVEDMLIGKIAGVHIQSESGQPGEASDIRIRGVGSVFSPQKPLIVVDGIIGGSYNPNDIESVSILKDAGATGLYGSAAAAGVVLIQTKRGKAGASEIRAKITSGIKKPVFGNFEMMNTEELYAYHKWVISPALFPNARPESLLDTDFDWINETYKQSNITSTNISASGASEKTNYYLSFDYMDDEGTLRGTNYERYSIRSNITYKLNERVSLGSNIVFNYRKSAFAAWNMSEGVFRAQPWDQPYDADGNLIYDVGEAGWLSNLISNPYHSEKYNKEGDEGKDASATFTLDVKIFDWLKFDSKTTLSMGYGKYELIESPLSYEGATDGGRMTNSIYSDQSIGNTTLLKFNQNFGSHGIDGLVGVELGKWKGELDYGGVAVGFLNGQEVLGVVGTQISPSGYIVESSSTSILSQVNYNYEKKYFATLSFRRDGRSEFAPNHKKANFFTGAASWLISSEDFMKQIKAVNYLKLRASYGAIGNSSFPGGNHYPYFPSFSASGTYNGQTTYTPTQAGNYNLTWETSYPLNLGLDLGLFNRIEINLDYYTKNTKDLLFQNPMPASQGYEYQWANVGEINNSGIELAINATAVKTKDFTWSINFNTSANKNELKALSDKDFVTEMIINDGTQILTVGGGAFDWYMPKWLGVDPDNGKPLWEDIIYDDNGNEIDRVATSVYTDAAEDYQIMGSPFPDFLGGFGTFMSYKNFSLTAAFSYSVGNKIYHSSRQELDNDGENLNVNAMKLQDGWSRWINPGDHATHPDAIYGGNLNSNKYSSRYLEDGSYLRLRNVTLAYDLPREYAEKLKINDLRLTLSMDNIVTWTDYSGLDPDVPLYGTPGMQFFKYPISKQMLLGLEFSF